jgi:carbamate kinase
MIDEGHFAPGSMRPKIEAAIQFARTPGRRAIICDPASALDAIEGQAGTTIAVT